MNSSNAPDIRFAQVEKRFTTDERTVLAVDRTDLLVRGGEFLVLLGPSGCGKTTMLRMIAGLIRPSAGKIHIGSNDLWLGEQRNTAVTGELGVVFQDANLFPWFSIEKNVSLPLKLRGVSKSERLAKARQLCELWESADLKPHGLVSSLAACGSEPPLRERCPMTRAFC